MTENNARSVQIGRVQLFALLTLSGLFAALTAAPAGIAEEMFYLAAFAALRLPLVWALTALIGKRADRILHCTAARIVLWLLCAGACLLTAAQLTAFMAAVFRGYSAWGACAVLLAICGVAAYQGLEALGRGCCILLTMAAAILALELCFAIPDYTLLNLTVPHPTVAGGAARLPALLLSSPELLAAPLLCQTVQPHGARSVLAWQAADFALRAGLCAAALLLLGGYAGYTAYPVFTAIAGGSGNADALALALVVICGFARITLFLLLCCFLWEKQTAAVIGGRTAARNTALLLLCAGVLLLAGCSAGTDISRRAVASAVTVTAQKDGIFCSVECTREKPDGEKKFLYYEGSGETFAGAITAIQRDEGIDLYLAGCRWLLTSGVGDRAALTKLLRAVDEDGRLPRGVRVIFSERATLRREDGISCAGLLDGTFSESRMTLMRLLGILSDAGRGALLPATDESGKLTGYFCANRQQALLLPPEITGSFLYLGQSGRTVTVTGEITADLVLETLRVRTKAVASDPPSFLIEIKASGYLSGAQADQIDETVLRRAKTALDEKLRAEMQTLLEAAVHAGKNDIFSFGKKLELQDSKAWQTVGQNWEQILGKVEWTIQTKIKLRDKRRLFLREFPTAR